MADFPVRLRYFEGQLLSPSDLEAEQQYHRDMRYLHNRLHGFGVVWGLDVDVSRGRVQVSPGLGIDSLGREIVVPTALTIRLEPRRKAQRWVRDLVISWHECQASPVASSAGGDEYTRWVEEPRLDLVARGRGASEALALARLTRTARGTVDVDHSVRRPLAPA